ncbi:MAG: UDP-N-acetylmuramoyl-L-alanyl-D-glutamate--2,6-diaminopimelate ligase [Paracoccaceae bacterium]
MTQRMTLGDLGLSARGAREVAVTDVTIDSRRVAPGALFAALPGTRHHGARFAPDVVAARAAAILTDAEGAALAQPALAGTDVALVVVEDAPAALAQAAALWFGPAPATCAAVTGTNGKTSVSSFCRQLWAAMGLRAVNLGTTGVEGAWSHPLRHTTPDPVTLHRALAQAARHGVTHAAMEASSHGLDQRRLDGVHLAAAGFTNFTQDHLDYHGSFEAYFDAKMRLFDALLGPEGVAAVNLDDPKGGEVARRCEARGIEVIGVGRHAEARLRVRATRATARGQDIRFDWQGAGRTATLDLIGSFQADNALLAAAMCIGAGAEAGAVFDALGQLSGVRGRMQHAATRGNGAQVFVDYAHTPDAIATALRAMRPHVLGRLIAVIGAGGDRDPTKRAPMGAAAAAQADLVVITDDNPRSEEPASIRAQVRQGAPDALDVGDRAEAILTAVDMAEAGDAVLICGKGHETGQTVGDAVHPFDDVEQASMAALALDGAIR